MTYKIIATMAVISGLFLAHTDRVRRADDVQRRGNNLHRGLSGTAARLDRRLHRRMPDAGQLLQANRLLGQRDQPLLRSAAAVMPHGLASSIAAAAAMNGSGSDTAARSQTTRAGIIGISQITSRWIA